MRIAVIDIGTNTTRLYAAELDGRTVTHELIRVSRVTRLGAGVDASGRLADDSLAREYAVLEDYRHQLDELRPDRAVAVMTSDVRDAENGPEFARVVEQRFGITIPVLALSEGATLAVLADRVVRGLGVMISSARAASKWSLMWRRRSPSVMMPASFLLTWLTS